MATNIGAGQSMFLAPAGSGAGFILYGGEFGTSGAGGNIATIMSGTFMMFGCQISSGAFNFGGGGSGASNAAYGFFSGMRNIAASGNITLSTNCVVHLNGGNQVGWNLTVNTGGVAAISNVSRFSGTVTMAGGIFGWDHLSVLSGGTLAGSSGTIVPPGTGLNSAYPLFGFGTNSYTGSIQSSSIPGHVVQPVQNSTISAGGAIITYTPFAHNGSYQARISIDCTAASAAILGWTVSFTDMHGNPQTPTNLALYTAGVATPTLTVTGAVNGIYSASFDFDTDNSQGVITISITFSGTSFTARVSSSLIRVA